VPTDGHWSLFGNHSFQRALVSNLRPLTPVRHYERVRLQRAAPIMELDPDKHFELILFGCLALLIGVVVFVIYL
jgi:hypothetical protein